MLGQNYPWNKGDKQSDEKKYQKIAVGFVGFGHVVEFKFLNGKI
jgi:hypothetical protein